MSEIITAEELKKKHRACYSIGRLLELFPGPGRSLREVLTLREGPWSKVSDSDRVWVALRPGFLTRSQMLEFLARLVERTLAPLPLPDIRSVAVIAALRSDNVTLEVRYAADAALRSAERFTLAPSASGVAAAARVAAERAARVAVEAAYAYASAASAASAETLAAEEAALIAQFASEAAYGYGTGERGERGEQIKDLLELIGEQRGP